MLTLANEITTRGFEVELTTLVMVLVVVVGGGGVNLPSSIADCQLIGSDTPIGFDREHLRDFGRKERRMR